MGRAALVPAGHEPHGRVVQRVEHREVALPRDPEGELRPVQDELVDEDLAAAADRPHRVRRRAHAIVNPPSMTSDVPVTKPAASEAT